MGGAEVQFAPDCNFPEELVMYTADPTIFVGVPDHVRMVRESVY